MPEIPKPQVRENAFSGIAAGGPDGHTVPFPPQCGHLLRSAAGCPICDKVATEVATTVRLDEPVLPPARAPEPEEPDPEEIAARLERTRRCLKRSFRAFVEYFWQDSGATYALLPSVAVDVICDALQATTTAPGDLHPLVTRLAIACPPGVSKSIICAVLYPAWLLLRSEGNARVMVGSYSWSFAERDSERCRTLVKGPRYQEMVGGRWSIVAARDSVSDWWTTAGGRRLIASIEGKAMGERVDYQVIDDALSANDRFSDAKRKDAANWVTQVLPSRLDEMPSHKAVRVIVGQRLAVDDPTGVVLAADPEGKVWKYCCLPAYLEEGEAGTELIIDGRVVWKDRRAPLEVLFEGLSHEVMKGLRDPSALGETRFRCEYLQKPINDAGAVVARSLWRFHAPKLHMVLARPAGCDEALVIESPDRFDRVVIAADLTFGSQKGDFACAQAWGAVGADRFLLRMWHKRAGMKESAAALIMLHDEFPYAKIIVEKAANGKGVEEELAAAGVPNVIMVPAIGSKRERIAMVSATIESGNCYLLLGMPKLALFVEELAGATRHDDIQDTAAYAIHELNKHRGAMWGKIFKPKARVDGPPVLDVVAQHAHYYVDGACVRCVQDAQRGSS